MCKSSTYPSPGLKSDICYLFNKLLSTIEQTCLTALDKYNYILSVTSFIAYLKPKIKRLIGLQVSKKIIMYLIISHPYYIYTVCFLQHNIVRPVSM